MPVQYSLEKETDTLAQKSSRRLRIYRILAIGLVLIALAAVVWFYTTATVASQKALRNAKDLRMAMKMMSIEQYSSGGSIFDPKQSDGLIQGGGERLAALSDAPGTVTLTGWDQNAGEPLSFTYKEGNYIVMFRKNAEQTTSAGNDAAAADEDNQWEVYLYLRVTNFH